MQPGRFARGALQVSSVAWDEEPAATLRSQLPVPFQLLGLSEPGDHTSHSPRTAGVVWCGGVRLSSGVGGSDLQLVSLIVGMARPFLPDLWLGSLQQATGQLEFRSCGLDQES